MHATARFLVSWAFIACGATLPPASAKTIHVDQRSGNDSHPGSQTAPVQTLPRALALATGGDTLVVGPGHYFHAPLTLADLPGTASAPTRLLAVPPGEATLSAAWPEAAQGTLTWEPLGNGIYRSARSRGAGAMCGGWNGHFLFRYQNAADLSGQTIPTSKGAFAGPRWGFAMNSDGRYHLRLPGNANPNGQRLIFASEFPDGTQPVLRVQRSPHLVIDGFRIEGGGPHGIEFDEASRNALVRNCVFTYCNIGVGIASDSIVEWCEHAFPGFRELHVELSARNPGKRNVLFQMVKHYGPKRLEGGLGEATLVGTPAKQNAVFRFNYVHNVFDGLQLGTFDHATCHDSVFVDVFDNPVQFDQRKSGQRARHLAFHHNLILGYNSGAISHQTQGDVLEGPHYVYRNVIEVLNDDTWNPYWVLKTLANPHNGQSIQAIGYFHNLFHVRDKATLYSLKSESAEAERRTTFFNNLFAFDTRVVGFPSAPLPTFDFNHVIQGDGPAPSAAGLNGTFLGTSLAAARLRDPAARDYGLLAGSPLINAARRLQIADLPQLQANAVGTPDIGPFELEHPPGPEWPRPRRTVFAPSSGTPPPPPPPPPTESTPYFASPASLPGRVEAEHFDRGGEGVAYHDSDPSNNGNASRAEGVDIEATTDSGGGLNVGWIQTGEWLIYTVNIASAGAYDVTLRCASATSGGAARLELNGSAVTPSVLVPGTGGWQTWTDVVLRKVPLTAGTHRLRFVADTGGFNLNALTFARSAEVAPIKINFQDASSAGAPGYLPDTGQMFGERGSGLRYGWNPDASHNARNRNVHAEERLDTLNHFQRGGTFTWELALPPGRYDVTLTAGDPAYTDQLNSFLIEGQLVTDPDGTDAFDTHRVTVPVSDGRLTLAPSTTAQNAKILSLEVAPTLAP